MLTSEVIILQIIEEALKILYLNFISTIISALLYISLLAKISKTINGFDQLKLPIKY